MIKLSTLNKLTFIIPLFFFLSQLSYSNFEFPAPDKLIEEGQKSRINYLDALNKIERISTEIYSGEQFLIYLYTLETLSTFESNWDFDTWGSSPSKTTGALYTKQGLKWMRLNIHTNSQLELFFKWADDANRFNFINFQEEDSVSIHKKELLLMFLEKISTVKNVLIKLNAASYVIEGFHQFEGRFFERIFLQRDEFTESELLKLVALCQSPICISSLLTYIQKESFSSQNSSLLVQNIKHTLILFKNMEPYFERLPLFTRQLPGQIIQESIINLLFSNNTPHAFNFQEVLNPLSSTQLLALSQSISFIDFKKFNNAQLDFLDELSVLLYQKLYKMGFGERLLPLEKLISSLKEKQLSENKKFEGTYEVKVEGSPLPHKLTIAQTGTGKIVMALSNNEIRPFLTFSFFFFTYNILNKTYESNRFSQEMPDYLISNERNYHIRFKYEQQSIRGEYSDGRRFYKFSGTKIENYKDYSSYSSNLGTSEVWGTYEAKELITREGGKMKNVRLIIRQVGQRLTATLYQNNGYYLSLAEFNYGSYSQRSGAVYLTTGENKNFTWTQFRGQLKRGGIEFQSIMGGSGIITQNVFFEKITVNEEGML